MTGNDIRQRFLDFFQAHGHRVVRSSSLLPANDPTLLFANAGMNQFKEVFLGLEKRDYTRATTSQKCVRAGGKHNDLENVGYTRRHHTFFEMLGNFSFGDYFKADAIRFAWDLVTKEYGMPKDRLYVTVFREDDEAEQLWQSVAGVPRDRIFRLDEKDNFWQMGETGPCGPCSEIHYDLGPEGAEPGREHEQFPLDGGGRFVEIWNLVFMQYNKDAAGIMTPLPKPSIDTGMGLERVAAILQGKLSNYDSDLILPIIQHTANLFGVEYGADPKTDVALRINADHARATAFLIHDGVLPSNEGRGYVLRKIMRRAMRNARLIGREEPYLFELTGFVAELMRPAYPELMESVQRVARVVKDEEHRYATTFLVAEKIFQRKAAELTEMQTGWHSQVVAAEKRDQPQLRADYPGYQESRAAAKVLSGKDVFELYDTYGLALDEQEDMARERGLGIDHEGFMREMRAQRERSRASWKGAEKGAVAPAYQELVQRGRTKFLGYEKLCAASRVVGLLVNQQLVDSVAPEVDAELVLDQTPFYAETGGQVGDRGTLDSAGGGLVATVASAYPAVPGLTVHRIKTHAVIRIGDELRAEVAQGERLSTERNHTATHLLHAALRQVLGTHVKQAGSVVEPPRLRFDFAHYTAMDQAEIEEVERLVNEQILRNTSVTTDVMPLDRAISTGAMALFGEKYGDEVRVVQVPDFSKELCGGTHVRRTGDIGVFKIVNEGSISAGVRRIEAVTGEGGLRQFQQTCDSLHRIAQILRTSEADLIEQIERSLGEKKTLERQVEALKQQAAQAAAGSLEGRAQTVNGAKVLAARIDGMDRAQLRALVDSLRNKWKSAAVVLASVSGAEVAIVAGVTKDLTSKVQAGKLVSAVAQATGGKGGGRPDMAEGGGKDPARLADALENVSREVAQKL